MFKMFVDNFKKQNWEVVSLVVTVCVLFDIAGVVIGFSTIEDTIESLVSLVISVTLMVVVAALIDTLHAAKAK